MNKENMKNYDRQLCHLMIDTLFDNRDKGMDDDVVVYSDICEGVRTDVEIKIRIKKEQL